MKKYEDTFLGLIMLLAVSLLASRGLEAVEVSGQAQEALVVALDPGHGGVDPGKVGSDGVLEKDLNLAIALKVQEELEEAGITVVMTRADDSGLYQEQDRNKKMADLKARCRLAEQQGAALVVSIHQNSYHDGSVRGPQVFYYKASEEGRQLAESIQEAFEPVTPYNRTPKANDNYYLLLHTPCPAAIVECGFLSCPEEAALLGTEEYQQKLAEAIAGGIQAYQAKSGSRPLSATAGWAIMKPRNRLGKLSKETVWTGWNI